MGVWNAVLSEMRINIPQTSSFWRWTLEYLLKFQKVFTALNDVSETSTEHMDCRMLKWAFSAVSCERCFASATRTRISAVCTELKLLGSTLRARYSRDATVSDLCLLLEVAGNQNWYRNAYLTRTFWCSHRFVCCSLRKWGTRKKWKHQRRRNQHKKTNKQNHIKKRGEPNLSAG